MLLPRTPAPRATESLWGYALRLSETNGYDTPWHLLSYAGLNQREMKTAGFPVEKLAAIVGREAAALTGIAYCADEPSGRHFKVLDHSLGGRMTDGWLRLTKPEFCPRCAAENGYLDAFWDLSHAVACPKHGCRLLRICPACGQKLRWFRAGLVECQCGANLVDTALPPASPAVVQLMAVMQAKLRGTSVLGLTNESGFPLAELDPMPFRAFLMMLDRMAGFAVSSHGKAKLDPYQAMERTAQAFADWPRGYHAFLQCLGTALKRDGSAATGLRKQFAPFYQSMFKANPFAADFVFLRNEFINFGKTVWGEAVIDQKLLRGDMELDGRFQSQRRTARDIGVRPITLQRWAEKGLIPAKEIGVGCQRRYIYDMAQVSVAAKTVGRIFETRKAAAHISLPVSLLAGLKKSGQYTVAHMPLHKPGFHELDLALLRSRIIERAAALDTPPSDEPTVSLEYVLEEVRFWSKDGKVGFVAAYLDGEIDAVGRTGESWDKVFFRKADVETHARRSRMEASNGAVSQQEAASRLGCGIDVVAGLLTKGLLEGITGPDRIRVTEASLDQFASDHVGLAAIAKREQTSVRRLGRLCMVCGIETIGITRRSGSVAKFIRIAEQRQLLAAKSVNPA